MAKYSSHYTRQKKQAGFTLLELMVGIAIVAILVTVGLPSLNQFTLQMRVDNEISEMHRLLLTARNSAVNTGLNVTVCPLKSDNTCGTDWTDQITVFTDVDANSQYTAATEDIIKVKDAVKDNDKLEFAAASFIYGPEGQLISANSGLIAYCPYGEPKYNRGLVVAASGRVAATSDIDNDGKDETRAGAEVSCSS